MLIKLQTWWNRQKYLSDITSPEVFVLVILLFFGTFLSFRIPLGAGFDEETHLLRVWEMSSFEWIPNTKLSNQMHFPAFYWDNSYRRQPILDPIEPDFWSNFSKTPIDGFGMVSENLTTRSVYSPLLLLPQSLVMFFFGRVLHLPALTVLIAMRILGLIFYTLLVWLAVRLAPYGKWMWAILVLSPMAIYQASTISTDSMSNGIGFLFVSYCLLAATLTQIKWKNWIFLGFLFVLLFFAKVNMAGLALLPFFILSPTRFKMKRGLLLLGILAFLLALIETGGWNILAYSRFFTALPGANPIGQLSFVITHPISTIGIFFTDIVTHIFFYLKGWIADFGYGYWGPPWVIYLVYSLALVATLFINGDTQPSKRTRIGLFIVFGLSFLITVMSLYISYTPVGSVEIQGVHGRYFSLVFPLLFLGIYGIPKISRQINHSLLTKLSIGLTVLGILLFSVGMYLAFYIRCGTAYYHAGLCYQPVYKNWSPNSRYFLPISSNTNLTQWIIPKCNGMNTIRVWLDASDSEPNGTTQFILNDEDYNIIQLVEVISNSDLPNKGWFTLTFPEDWQSGGKWYTLTVQAPQNTSGKGIRLASTIQAEYIDAPLIQDGKELEKDMVFQYGCIAGWEALYNKLITLINKQ
jgi:uncharacterized membrane protein